MALALVVLAGLSRKRAAQRVRLQRQGRGPVGLDVLGDGPVRDVVGGAYGEAGLGLGGCAALYQQMAVLHAREEPERGEFIGTLGAVGVQGLDERA